MPTKKLRKPKLRKSKLRKTKHKLKKYVGGTTENNLFIEIPPLTNIKNVISKEIQELVKKYTILLDNYKKIYNSFPFSEPENEKRKNDLNDKMVKINTMANKINTLFISAMNS